MKEEFTMSAGEYWLGDPCYAIKMNQWDEYIDLVFRGSGPFEFKGHTCIAFSTAYGDGEYEVQYGNKYPVDAGMIGLTPVAVSVKRPFGSKRVVFDKPLSCCFARGLSVFGKYEINTDPQDDEEY